MSEQISREEAQRIVDELCRKFHCPSLKVVTRFSGFPGCYVTWNTIYLYPKILTRDNVLHEFAHYLQYLRRRIKEENRRLSSQIRRNRKALETWNFSWELRQPQKRKVKKKRQRWHNWEFYICLKKVLKVMDVQDYDWEREYKTIQRFYARELKSFWR